MKSNNIAYVIFLSVVAALGGFLFGYDTAVISGSISQVTALYHLDAMQQGWYVGCALVGSIAGVSVAGLCSDIAGRKRTLLFSAILFSASGVGCAIAQNIGELIAFRIVGGVGIGMVSIISPMYISEIAISKYRGRLVSSYQLAITIGFLGAYLVNYELLQVAAGRPVFTSPLLQKVFVDEVWRGMLGMESVPALLFLVVIFFIPESPRWLVLKHRSERARTILARIYRDPAEAGRQFATLTPGSGASPASFSQWQTLLQPANRKAILVGMAIAILGQLMGVNAVLYYGPTIFRNSGLSDGDSLFYQVLVGLVNVLTTVLALVIIDKVGRKKLVYYGVSGMIVSLILIGLYFWKGAAAGFSNIFLLCFFLFYIFCCAVSVCAVVFVLLSEMYPTAIRGVAMSIAGFALWIGTYLIGQLTPWMLDHLTPSGTFFLFTGMCFPYLWIIWKQVPETTGKSLEEIEGMWIG